MPTPSTVNSIPWMPERAWTVARASCAISGLTRSDYSPENVQPNPPCEGPLPEGVPIVPQAPCETPPTIIAVDPEFNYTLDPDGYARVTVASMLSYFDPGIVWWELSAISEGPFLIWSGPNPYDLILLGCNAFTLASWQVKAYSGCPIGADCMGSVHIPQNGSSGTYDCYWDTTYTPGNQGTPGPPSYFDCGGIPNDCLPRYVPWREMPRTPDFDGGEGLTVWQRSLGWTFPDNCPPPDPPT